MQIIPSGAQRLLVRLPAGAGAMDLFRAGTATASLVRSAAVLASDAGTFVGSGLSHTSGGFQWHPVVPMAAVRAMHPWDAAHALAERSGADLGSPVYVEPDFLVQPAIPVRSPEAAASMAAADPCAESGFNPDWGPMDGVGPDWHLGPDFSGLKPARDVVGDRVSAGGRRVRIGHLDTGYDPNHCSVPLRLMTQMAWNFVENNNNAVAPRNAGGLFPDPSHGTATLALLAGKQVPLLGGQLLGGAPYAEVVPVRIANTWLHLSTSAMAGGIDHAVGCGCDVLSISAGGLPAQSWADAVNNAYDKGCCLFAASGDSSGGLPTHLTIYPARFRRVVSVCGVTHDRQPYYREAYTGTFKLEGSWGPPSAMETAVSAYAPNVPWARQGCATACDRDGGGTSAATPQAAAAAALWLQLHFDDLNSAQPWQKVEAVRFALFSTARPGDPQRLGHGAINARAALDVGFDPAKLPSGPQPPDTIDFAFLKVLFGLGAFGLAQTAALPSGLSEQRRKMLEVEAAQLAVSVPQIAQIVGDADVATEEFPSNTRRDLVNAIRNSPAASDTLKGFMNTVAPRL